MNETHDLYLENKRLNIKEIGERAIKLNSRPRRLMFALTGRCNISCIMCERRTNDFSLPKKVVQGLTGLFPYLDLVMWQGGEVFLVDYFKELFQETSRHTQLVQEINTNGLLFNEEWTRIIEKANTRLVFSIDSTRKDIYEYIRKGARFERLIANIDMINEMERRNSDLKLEKNINIVIMHSNYRTLGEFVDFAVKYSFSGLNFLNMIGDFCPQENIFRPPDIEALDYLKREFPLVIKRADSCGITISHELSPILDDSRQGSSGPSFSDDKKLFCLMPWASLFIDGSQEGAVYPECLCRRPIGNIFKDSLDEIWNSDDMRRYREKIVNKDIENWCNPNCVKGLVSKDFLQNL